MLLYETNEIAPLPFPSEGASKDEVAAWLVSISPNNEEEKDMFVAYSQSLKQQFVNGKALRMLTDAKLEKYGVTALGHRDIILAAIQGLVFVTVVLLVWVVLRMVIDFIQY